MRSLIPIIFVLIIVIVGCSTKTEEIIEKDNEIKPVEVVSMKLTSPAFGNNKEIPSEYTCDGSDTSPELNIEDVPENTKSLVLISDDPDAPVGTWDHWVVFNIPPETTKIEKGTEPQGTAGSNSWGKTGYGGPCPPSGTHRYFFKLYALDTTLDLKEGSNKEDLEAAMKDHIIGQAKLMGIYKRK